MSTGAEIALHVRELRPEDRDDVIRIHALHTGQPRPEYWERVFRDYLSGETGAHVGVAAERDGRFVGYVLGEVRAFEFGSEACGWIFAVGVEPGHTRIGIASGLLEEACRRFQAAGVSRVRTMVQRTDVPVLAFFRANGFVGGSFVQLELELEEGP